METDKIKCSGCQKEEFIKITTFTPKKYYKGFCDRVRNVKSLDVVETSTYYACRVCGLKYNDIYERSYILLKNKNPGCRQEARMGKIKLYKEIDYYSGKRQSDPNKYLTDKMAEYVDCPSYNPRGFESYIQGADKKYNWCSMLYAMCIKMQEIENQIDKIKKDKDGAKNYKTET